LHGHIAHAVIEVAESPGADADARRNNSILATLPKPFRAVFFGGDGDDDGEFCWDAEIELTMTRLDGLGNQVASRVKIDPGRAPLEVGYTMPGRTLGHLRTEGFLARWPYSWRRIGLFFQLSRADDSAASTGSSSLF